MSKKLKVGDVLVGTCKEDKSKKDLFLVLNDEDGEENYRNLVCLTRAIGWKRSCGRTANNFETDKVRTVEELNDYSGFDSRYSCYEFKRVKRLSVKNIHAICSTVSERKEEE